MVGAVSTVKYAIQKGLIRNIIIITVPITIPEVVHKRLARIAEAAGDEVMREQSIYPHVDAELFL